MGSTYYHDPPQNGITWRLAITKPVRMTPTYDVTIDGDTLAGTVKVGILPPSSVTGTRVIEQ